MHPFSMRILNTAMMDDCDGLSGTNKAMSAEVIAKDVGKPLYRVGSASVVSKYIGENEKNLKRIFEAATAGNAVLFFDEADTLFGKRSEARDSHEGHAERLSALNNREVNLCNFTFVQMATVNPPFAKLTNLVADFSL